MSRAAVGREKRSGGDVVSLSLAYLLAHGRWGRRRLARQTGLSEMAVRLALERLRAQGLVELSPRGAGLTPEGRHRFLPVTSRVRGVCPLRLSSLIRAPVAVGALVDASPSRPPWWYRDLAVREGAEELLLLSFRSGELRFPQTLEPVGAKNPEDAARLYRAFSRIQEGEVVVAVGASTSMAASRGLWRVIGALLSPLES